MLQPDHKTPLHRAPPPATRPAWLLVAAMLVITGCATSSYQPNDIAQAAFMSRKLTQTENGVTVSVAVPDKAETEAFFGLPLYQQGVQPVWVEVTNSSPGRARLSLWSIDPDYYSPLEVAWLNRKSYSKNARMEMERWFYEQGADRRIPPGETRSGFVFTHLQEGTKGFNTDVILEDLSLSSFTFFVPIPGFTPDYMQVDFDNLYTADETQNLDLEGLRKTLEKIVCCGTDATGEQQGAPFNVALVGTGTAVHRALMRAGWQETEAASAQTEMARKQHYRGRYPDGTFFKARADGSERRELRLWLTPYRVGEDLVWLGQTGLVVSKKKRPDLVVSRDLDGPVLFLLQNFWYTQSLTRIGFTQSYEPVSRDSPNFSFTGRGYFTNGLRGVLWLSEEPVALDEVENLEWERWARD